MSSTSYMATYMREYRNNNTEFYEKQKANFNNKYNNDLEYREQKKKKVLERYYKLKQQKQNSLL